MAALFDLSGKTAVITGGNGGIGLAMAKALAEHGCAVAIWGRNADKTGRALEELRALGGAVHAEICDVTSRPAVEQAFEGTVAALGPVDGCFANAGAGGADRGSFLSRSFDDWRAMFEINLDSTFHVLQVAARHMADHADEKQPRGGRLVAVSSIASLFGYALNEHYGASKIAVNGLIRALGVELARYGITANAILPGFSAT
ncbi:MAG: SDR family oxidoreductase, partial [Gammaproteobacteria bacterium]|nr:SDR family oxidoreductase [Gammaproteobacteria bacterium]